MVGLLRLPQPFLGHPQQEGDLSLGQLGRARLVDDFAAAAKANAMVGGDNAARAVAIGMVLGAFHGVEGIPQLLQDGLNAWGKCDELLTRLLELKAPLKGEL